MRKPATLTEADELRYTIGTEARYPSGKGEVCKTFMREFDSHPRLQNPRNKTNLLHRRFFPVVYT